MTFTVELYIYRALQSNVVPCINSWVSFYLIGHKNASMVMMVGDM